jgi:catalase-peroxidase
MLFGYDWNLVKSPSGAWQWVPANVADKDLAPAAHDPSKKVTTIMTTADLALRMDPIYGPDFAPLPQGPASLR